MPGARQHALRRARVGALAAGGQPLSQTYLGLVGNGRMVVIVVIIVPHSSIPILTKGKERGPEPHRLICWSTVVSSWVFKGFSKGIFGVL